MTYVTKTGKILTDADIEALSDEADRGYATTGLTRCDRIFLRGWQLGVDTAYRVLNLEHYTPGKRSSLEIPDTEDVPLDFRERIEYLKGFASGMKYKADQVQWNGHV